MQHHIRGRKETLRQRTRDLRIMARRSGPRPPVCSFIAKKRASLKAGSLGRELIFGADG